MMNYRHLLMSLLGVSCLATTGLAEPKTALLTFSGLFNQEGAKPEQKRVSPTYQPLMAPAPNTNPKDGADLGVKITWEGCGQANPGSNAVVKDHTQDAAPDKKELGGGVLFASSDFGIKFSDPVEIPSFCWTRFGGTKSEVKGFASVYVHATDTTPVKTVPLIYVEDRGYQWAVEKGFAGLKITKIVFQQWDQPKGTPNPPTPLNLDDITIVRH